MNEDEQKGFIDYLIGTLGKVQKMVTDNIMA